MTLYIIRDDTVTAYASAPARASEDELRVRSAKEIETSGMSNAQMAAIWNALPGTAPVAKFKDRKTAVQRLWAAFGQLPVSSDRKSTRLNSSHVAISYAVFCLKK